MMRPVPQGRYIYAVAILALGVEHLICAHSGPRYIPIIPWIPAIPLLAYVIGAFFVVTAACILANFRARSAAIILGVFYLVSDVALLIDKLLPTPIVMFEILALAAGALTLARTLSPAPSNSASGRLDIFLQSGRYIFAICLLLFGAYHFIYFRLVAGLVPTWIPGGGSFWTAVTGSAMIAGGVAFAIKRLDLWAANLLGLMYLLFVLVLHIPRLMSPVHSHDPDEWSSAIIALAMCGVCWILGRDSWRNKPAPGA